MLFSDICLSPICEVWLFVIDYVEISAKNVNWWIVIESYIRNDHSTVVGVLYHLVCHTVVSADTELGTLTVTLN